MIFTFNTDHRYKISIDGMEYLQLIAMLITPTGDWEHAMCMRDSSYLGMKTVSSFPVL